MVRTASAQKSLAGSSGMEGDLQSHQKVPSSHYSWRCFLLDTKLYDGKCQNTDTSSVLWNCNIQFGLPKHLRTRAVFLFFVFLSWVELAHYQVNSSEWKQVTRGQCRMPPTCPPVTGQACNQYYPKPVLHSKNDHECLFDFWKMDDFFLPYYPLCHDESSLHGALLCFAHKSVTKGKLMVWLPLMAQVACEVRTETLSSTA